MNNFQGILTSIKIPKIYLAFLKSTLLLDYSSLLATKAL